MTDTMPPVPEFLRDESVTTPPAGTGRRRTLRALIALAIVAPLAATTYYGVTQHQHANALTVQRDNARHALATTSTSLKATRDNLDTTEDALNTAQDQLGTCADVGTAAQELFSAADSLTNTVINVLDGDYGTSGLDSANDNVDKVQGLIDDGGFDSLDDMVAACTDGNTGTGI